MFEYLEVHRILVYCSISTTYKGAVTIADLEILWPIVITVLSFIKFLISTILSITRRTNNFTRTITCWCVGKLALFKGPIDSFVPADYILAIVVAISINNIVAFFTFITRSITTSWPCWNYVLTILIAHISLWRFALFS